MIDGFPDEVTCDAEQKAANILAAITDDIVCVHYNYKAMRLYLSGYMYQLLVAVCKIGWYVDQNQILDEIKRRGELIGSIMYR